ncbi:MAG: 3-isopropylmalate dehydrogenase, partial [Moorea sp. SIO4G2]|nr:3-isopropylmalate dehydrogenase [Moorena sp. SIO4G2]
AAMMLRYGLDQPEAADCIEQAVVKVLDKGDRTGDIISEGMTLLGCRAMGESLIQCLEES